MFRGSMVALVTPFKNGQLDEGKLKELVEFQIDNGTTGILPCGTTGESPTLSHEEHDRVVEIVIKAVAKRVPVLAGSGSNSTHEALRLTQHAKDVGADGALVITPYYNKPTQAGLFEHYKAIAQSVDIPIMIYNVPGRTGIAIEVETVAKLVGECKNIVAIKEASGSVDRVSALKNVCNIAVLSGDDGLTLPMMAVGAQGVISVAANIVPADTVALVKAFESGDLERAKELHYKMYNLFKTLFIETNPIPIKTAMSMVGMINEEFRLPLVGMLPGNKDKLRNALKEYGLLK